MWFDVDRPQIGVVDIFQGHGHDTSLPVDIDAAEELQSKTGRKVFALLRAATLLEHRLRPKRIVELAGAPCPRMQRARGEFPERLKILEDGAARIVMMRGGIVHVRCQPNHIANPGALDERQQIGDLVLAPLRRVVAERDRVFADQPNRQVGGDHLPGRVRCGKLAFQPGQLRRAENAAVAAVVAPVPGGIAITAHVDQEDVEQRPVRNLAIDPAIPLGDLRIGMNS